MSKTVIGIDRGASFTDFAVVRDEKPIDYLSVESRDWNDIDKTLEQIRRKNPTDHLAFSGASSGMPPEMKKRCTEVSEIDSIGLGGALLAGCKTCVVVSMGTGSAIVHVDHHKAAHVGGTGVGGGTIKGLASLLCGLDDPTVIEELALKGRAAQMNLTIGDLGMDDLSFLPTDATVSNFANIKSENIEDRAAGILSLVAETVGIMASLCAREAGCSENIVTVGKVAVNKHIRDTLKRVGVLYQTRFLHPEHPGCATAYGAAIKYLNLT